jgi:hypothetical protein
MLLNIAFGASTHSLIPLYAVGVFVSFTLSQAGMVMRWRKLRGPHWKRSALVNGIGALSTAVVSLVIIESKLREGAWAVVVLIPILVGMFMIVHRHYESFKEQVRLTDERAAPPYNLIVVPIENLDDRAKRALAFAHSIAGELHVVHVARPTDPPGSLQAQWQATNAQAPLDIVDDVAHSVTRTLLAYIAKLGLTRPDARLVILLPERAPLHFYHLFLHNQTALALKLALFFQPQRIVVSVPHDDHFEKAHEHNEIHRNIVVVPVARVDRATVRALNFAKSIAGEKQAVFVNFDAKEGEAMIAQWRAAQLDVPLKLIESPYRSVTGPLIRFIDKLSRENQDANVVVVLPEIVPKHLWQLALHNQTMVIFKFILLLRPHNRILVSVPYHLAR